MGLCGLNYLHCLFKIEEGKQAQQLEEEPSPTLLNPAKSSLRTPYEIYLASMPKLERRMMVATAMPQ